MDVFIERTGKNQKLKFSGTAGELLKKLNVNAEEVIVVRNDGIITLDVELSDKDKIRILSVISGG